MDLGCLPETFTSCYRKGPGEGPRSEGAAQHPQLSHGGGRGALRARDVAGHGRLLADPHILCLSLMDV